MDESISSETVIELKDRLQKLEENLRHAKEEEQSATSELQDAKTNIKKLQERVSFLEDESKKLNKHNSHEHQHSKAGEVDAGSAESELKEAAISILRDRVSFLETELKRERRTSRKLMHEMDTASANRTCTVDAPEDKKKDVRYLSAKLTETTLQLHEAMDTIQSLKQRNKLLENQLVRANTNAHPVEPCLQKPITAKQMRKRDKYSDQQIQRTLHNGG